MADLDPRIRPATPGALGELAAPSAGGPKVLSLFVNLDPSTFATAEARDSAVRSLVSEAGSETELETEEKKALRESLKLVEDFLSRNQDWAQDVDLVERASRLCLSTSAEVHVMGNAEPLKKYGSVPALLRF